MVSDVQQAVNGNSLDHSALRAGPTINILVVTMVVRVRLLQGPRGICP